MLAGIVFVILGIEVGGINLEFIRLARKRSQHLSRLKAVAEGHRNTVARKVIQVLARHYIVHRITAVGLLLQLEQLQRLALVVGGPHQGVLRGVIIPRLVHTLLLPEYAPCRDDVVVSVLHRHTAGGEHVVESRVEIIVESLALGIVEVQDILVLGVLIDGVVGVRLRFVIISRVDASLIVERTGVYGVDEAVKPGAIALYLDTLVHLKLGQVPYPARYLRPRAWTYARAAVVARHRVAHLKADILVGLAHHDGRRGVFGQSHSRREALLELRHLVPLLALRREYARAERVVVGGVDDDVVGEVAILAAVAAREREEEHLHRVVELYLKVGPADAREAEFVGVELVDILLIALGRKRGRRERGPVPIGVEYGVRVAVQQVEKHVCLPARCPDVDAVGVHLRRIAYQRRFGVVVITVVSRVVCPCPCDGNAEKAEK